MCKFIATLYQDAAGTTNVPLRDFRIHKCSIGGAGAAGCPLGAVPRTPTTWAQLKFEDP